VAIHFVSFALRASLIVIHFVSFALRASLIVIGCLTIVPIAIGRLLNDKRMTSDLPYLLHKKNIPKCIR